MMHLKKMIVLSVIFVCIVGLSGCSRTKIIDKISIIHAFGFDVSEKGELKGTALIPEFTESKDDSTIKYLEEEGLAPSLIVSKMSRQTITPVEIAKIRVLLFGKDFAEAGIKDVVERLIMTPQLGTHGYIAISEGSARDTLKIFKEEKSFTLADRIEHNIVGESLPDTNLHYFLNRFFGEGMDAYAPMITVDEKQNVKIDGLGIFKDDKLKYHLTREQCIIFTILEDVRSRTLIKITPEKESERKDLILARSFRSKKKWKWNKAKGELNLHLNLQILLTQYPEKYDVKKLKKIITKDVKGQIEDLLDLLKENEIDPLGIGNIVRSQDRTWEKESFYDKYPTLPINVKVDLDIINSGLED